MTYLIPLLALPFLAPQDDVLQEAQRLVAQLESDSIDRRTEAAQKLISMGEGVSPLLKKRRESARGELRIRLDDVIHAIERKARLALVFRPATEITIEAKNRPFKEVIEELKKQGTTPISDDAVPESYRVTVSLKGVPFWKALDAICKASGQVLWDVDSKKVRLKTEKYRARPTAFSGPLVVFVKKTHIHPAGASGGRTKPRLPRTHLVSCWEGGLKPERIETVFYELRDTKDLFPVPDDKVGFRSVTMSFGDGAISRPHYYGIGHKYAKIDNGTFRLNALFNVHFVAKYASAVFRDPERAGKLSISSDDLTMTLTRINRRDVTFEAELLITGAPEVLDPLAKEEFCLFGLKAEGWTNPTGVLRNPVLDKTGLTFKVRSLLPKDKNLEELWVKIPRETYVHPVKCDFGRLTFKK